MLLKFLAGTGQYKPAVSASQPDAAVHPGGPSTGPPPPHQGASPPALALQVLPHQTQPVINNVNAKSDGAHKANG